MSNHISDKTNRALAKIKQAKPGIYHSVKNLASWLTTVTGDDWSYQQSQDLLRSNAGARIIMSPDAKSVMDRETALRNDTHEYLRIRQRR
jgi:hypothetical protein